MDTGAWEVSAALVKALTYAASLGAAGLGLFSAYAAPPEILARALQQSVLRLAGASLLLTVVKWPLLAGALGGAAGVTDSALLRMVVGSGEGMAGLVRAGGLAVLCAGLLGSRARAALLVSGALLVAASFGMLGHVHARHRAVLSAVLALHVMGAAFWLGALWPLARMLALDPRRAAPVVARFGQLALAIVPLLVGAGLCLACVLLDTPGALWRSPYGRGLCVKLVLVGGLLALAARNKLRLTARLGIPGGALALQRAIRLEMLLAAAILALTAVLTTLTGPSE